MITTKSCGPSVALSLQSFWLPPIPAPGLTSRAILRLSRVNVVFLQCLDHHYSCAVLPFASLFSHSFTFLTLFGEPGPREAGFLQLRES